MKKTKGPSILDGTNEIINRHLFRVADIARMYQQKSSAITLNNSPEGFDASELLRDLFARISKNRKENRAQPQNNWREDPQIDKPGSTDEIKTERVAVIEARKLKPNWWNQMPIASGLAGEEADRRLAIDLVHKSETDGTAYKFIELKMTTKSGNPLFAMMEIVRYGLVYLALRQNEDWRSPRSQEAPVFNAGKVTLHVLAPHDYYKGYEFAWLEDAVSEGIGKLANEITAGSLEMGLACYWPRDWNGLVPQGPKEAQSILKNWKPAFFS